MGLNTVVVVLNDALWQIEKDADFGRALSEAVCGMSHRRLERCVPAGNHCNAAEVISTAHADFKQVVVVGGNTGWDINSPDVPDHIVEVVADRLRRKGWRVSKPRRTASAHPCPG